MKIEIELSEEDKAIADKAAKLIARDYGEVIKKLEDEDEQTTRNPPQNK